MPSQPATSSTIARERMSRPPLAYGDMTPRPRLHEGACRSMRSSPMPQCLPGGCFAGPKSSCVDQSKCPYQSSGCRTACSLRATRCAAASSATTRVLCSTESSSILPTKRALGNSVSARSNQAAVLQKHENWKPGSVLTTRVWLVVNRKSGQSTTTNRSASARCVALVVT